ncbi:MAG TPA: Lrp/AsnC family transcriptional regulator [Sphingomicrobium sp.]
MEQSLDEFDCKILGELQKDASRPVTQLAEAVGLSHAPAWRRIQRLRSEGYIDREVAILDREKLGWDLELFVLVKLNATARADINLFVSEIVKHDQVIGCFLVLGNVDLVLHVIARNIRDYERFFLEHLSQATGVHEANTITLLSRLKDSTAIPL